MIRALTKEEQFRRENTMTTFLEVDHDSESYKKAHIVRARFLPLDRIRELAPQYLPDLSADIMVYTRYTGPEDPAVAGVRILAQMGYENLFYLIGGLQDWMNGSYPIEAIHFPPQEPEPQPTWVQTPEGRPVGGEFMKKTA